MAAGASYNVQIIDANGDATAGEFVQFLDSVAQPLNSTLPVVLNGAAIPTADPHVVGQIWANSHVLTVSAG